MEDNILNTLTWGHYNNISNNDMIILLQKQYNIPIEKCQEYVKSFRLAEATTQYQQFGGWGQDTEYEVYDYSNNYLYNVKNYDITDDEGNSLPEPYDTSCPAYGHIKYFIDQESIIFN